MNSEKGKTGFSGLNALLSEIDVDNSSLSSQTKSGGATSSENIGSSANNSYDQKVDNRSKVALWIGGVLLAALAIGWVITMPSSKPNSSVKTPTIASSTTGTAQPTVSNLPATQKQPTVLNESKPAPGQNNILGVNEIQYCLAEKIRIQASQAIMNTQNNNQIDRFNSYVDDFNVRCAFYRYRSSSMTTAQTEVERYRSNLVKEGEARMR